MNAPSFKQLIKDGVAKRADAMKFRIEDIHEEPGFNLRDEGQELEASIDALAAHLVAGGIVPALEVRPRAEGGVFVVDGHRRRRAFLKVADQLRDPAGELYVPVVAFTGNDADRTARIITSAEGRALSPLEVARGYARLIGYGWTSQQVADKVGKTRQHVDQLLTLANANSDVQQLVRDGTVSATVAIETVRKHGEAAGAFLDGAAKAKGGGKVKSGDVKGKPLPPKLAAELEAAVGAFVDKVVLPQMSVDANTLAALLDVFASVRECRQKQATRGQSNAVRDAQGELA